jgi:hypothetical protein
VLVFRNVAIKVTNLTSAWEDVASLRLTCGFPSAEKERELAASLTARGEPFSICPPLSEQVHRRVVIGMLTRLDTQKSSNGTDHYHPLRTPALSSGQRLWRF